MERSFPRTPRRHAPVVLVVLAVLAALLATAIPLAHADDLEDKRDEVRKDIKSASAHLQETSAAYSQAMTRLRGAIGRLDAARKTYRATYVRLEAAIAADTAMRQQLAQARAQLTQARADLHQGQLDVVEQRDDIGRMAALNYAHGDPGLLKLQAVLTAQDPAMLSLRSNTIDGMMIREDTALQTLQELRDRLAAQEQRVELYEAKVAKAQQATAAQVARRHAIAVEARTQRNQVRALVDQRQALAKRAKQLRRADLRKLRRLRAEEDRIAEEIRIRNAQQSGGVTGVGNGFLTRPVPGYVTSPYGYRTHPIYGYYGLHNGTDFYTPCGQNMVAAASGTVVDIYYSSVYGNRLLLDVGRVNGKNMTLVYNHASGYRFREGARVRRGAVVGDAGSTGWSTGCHLHFMVLRNGTPVDPMGWM